MIITRSLEPAEAGIAQHILATALFDDPGAIYVSSRKDKRLKHLLALYRVVVSYVMTYGHVHIAVDQPSGHPIGVTLWLESSCSHPSILQEIRHGLVRTLFTCSTKVLINAIRFSEGVYSPRKRTMGETRYVYLWMMGVLPEYQGKGIGSQLMRHAFQDANIGERTCYVETFKQRNVAFYQNQGFEFILQKSLPKGPPFWTLIKNK